MEYNVKMISFCSLSNNSKVENHTRKKFLLRWTTKKNSMLINTRVDKHHEITCWATTVFEPHNNDNTSIYQNIFFSVAQNPFFNRCPTGK